MEVDFLKFSSVLIFDLFQLNSVTGVVLGTVIRFVVAAERHAIALRNTR